MPKTQSSHEGLVHRVLKNILTSTLIQLVKVQFTAIKGGRTTTEINLDFATFFRLENILYLCYVLLQVLLFKIFI